MKRIRLVPVDLNDLLTPKPMTQDDMKYEIASSRIQGKPHEEFPPKAITETLDALNLKVK